MLKAHTVIAMIATVMLLWGLSVVFRGLGARLPRLRRRAAPPASPPRPVSLPVTVFGALVAAGAAPVFWTSLQVNRWQRSFDPTIEPFTPWTGVAMGMVAFGAALVAWGLRGDRPRGRRRCPGCWYDMAGAPGLVCPECGREAAGPAELSLPRRNRRMVVAGLALALLAIVPYYTPRVQRGGWVAVVPTTALVLGLPWWPDEAIAGGARGKDDWSLLGRVEQGALFLWQERLLRSRARAGAQRAGADTARRLVRLGLEFEDAEMLRSATGSLLRAAVDERVDEVVRHDMLSLASAAVYRLSRLDTDASGIIDQHVAAIAPLLLDEDEYLAGPAAQALVYASDLGPAVDNLIVVFRRPVDWDLPADHPHMAVVQSPRFHAATALVVAAPREPAAAAALLDAIEGRLSPVHQYTALTALRMNSAVFDGLDHALAGRLDDPATATAAALALYSRREYMPMAVPRLADAIEAAADPPQPLVRSAAYIAGLGVDHQGRLEQLLDHPSPAVRAAVAVAMAESHAPSESWERDRLLAALREVYAAMDASMPGYGRLELAIEQVESRP